LAEIPDNAEDHDPSTALPPWESMNAQPYDGNQILPRSMTCSGGQNWHPDATRDFTLREYASLQGFPPNHVFRGAYRRKQIGNAVPPCVAKVLFEHIKRELDKRDGIVEEREALVIE
jgi:DNA (cytosine-5)-methyltransferase 1